MIAELLLTYLNKQLAVVSITIGRFYMMKLKTHILFNDGRFKKELGILPLKLFWLRSLSKLSHC
jgi:hypothetical protein